MQTAGEPSNYCHCFGLSTWQNDPMLLGFLKNYQIYICLCCFIRNEGGGPKATFENQSAHQKHVPMFNLVTFTLMMISHENLMCAAFSLLSASWLSFIHVCLSASLTASLGVLFAPMSHHHEHREPKANNDYDHGSVPNEINPLGPGYKKMRVQRVRYGRCICGRVAQWRFIMTDAPQKIGYDSDPESDPDGVHYDSEESSQESIPREQRRDTLGSLSDITLEAIQPKTKKHRTFDHATLKTSMPAGNQRPDGEDLVPVLPEPDAAPSLKHADDDKDDMEEDIELEAERNPGHAEAETDSDGNPWDALDSPPLQENVSNENAPAEIQINPFDLNSKAQ